MSTGRRLVRVLVLGTLLGVLLFIAYLGVGMIW